MDYINTLNNIFVSDDTKVGLRAIDLATLSRKGFNIPLTVVVNSQALEEYVKLNKLQEKGAKLLAEGKYEDLQREVVNGVMPENVMVELKEAYDTLSVGEDADASHIVNSDSAPIVTVIASPHYHVQEAGALQNIKGMEEVVKAVKQVWSALFSQSAFEHRKSIEVKEFFSGIIIQRMHASDVSASGESQENNITVKTWLGLPDLSDELGKDEFVVNKEYLRIDKSEIKNQNEKIARDENDQLERVPLEASGGEQKTDDKTVIELGRLTKKATIALKNDVKALYTIEKDQIYLLFAERLRQIEVSESEQEEAPATPAQDEPSADDIIEEVLEEIKEEPPEEPLAPKEDHVEDDGFMKELEKTQEAIEDGPPLYERKEEDEDHLEKILTTPKETEEQEETVEETPVEEAEPVEEVVEEKQEEPQEEEIEEPTQEVEEPPVEETPEEPAEEVVPIEEDVALTDEEIAEEVTKEEPEETIRAPEEPAPEEIPEAPSEEVSDSHMIISEPTEGIPAWEEPYEDEPEPPIEETPDPIADLSEPQPPQDDRKEHVSMLKDMINELDGLVEEGDDTEVDHKINEMHETIQKLRKN